MKVLVSAERTDRPASRRNTLAAGFAQEPEAPLLDFLAGIFLDMPSWSAIATFEAMYATDQIANLDEVSMPVFQIVGDRDRVHPMAGARWLQDRLRIASLEVIPEVGHYPMFESPAALNTFLGRSLESDATESDDSARVQ